MLDSSRQGFYFSVVLHAGIFLLLCASVLLHACQKTPPVHVFTMISPPVEMPAQATPPAPPKAAPAPQAPPKAEPKPKPAPAPKPVKKMSYEEYIRQQGKPKARNTPKQTAPPKPQLNAQALKQNLEKTLATATPVASTSAAPSPDALNSFIASLRERINRNWDKPSHRPGENPTAIAEFTVTPQGTIAQIQIIRSSGDTAFDESVRKALQRTQNVQTLVPFSQSRSFKLTFKMIEGLH